MDTDYILLSISESKNERELMFWSNLFGWTSAIDEAVIYTYEDILHYESMLPNDQIFVEMPLLENGITKEQKEKILKLVIKARRISTEAGIFDGQLDGVDIEKEDLEWITKKSEKLYQNFIKAKKELDDYLESLVKKE